MRKFVIMLFAVSIAAGLLAGVRFVQERMREPAEGVLRIVSAERVAFERGEARIVITLELTTAGPRGEEMLPLVRKVTDLSRGYLRCDLGRRPLAIERVIPNDDPARAETVDGGSTVRRRWRLELAVTAAGDAWGGEGEVAFALPRAEVHGSEGAGLYRLELDPTARRWAGSR